MCVMEEMDGKCILKNRIKIIFLIEGIGWLVFLVNLWFLCEFVDVEDIYYMIGVI